MNTGADQQKFISIQGTRLAALGFGTYTLNGNDCYEGVRDAIEIGYRHIDTAQMYANENETGRAIKDSGINREELFVTTKVWHTNLRREDAIQAAEDSLRKLGMDYVDLLLIHWPDPSVPVEETLDALLELQRQGKTKHIGVSNFTPELLTRALKAANLFAIQVEYHPFLSQAKLLEIARAHDMMLTAYSPIAQGRAAKDETLQAIGQQYGKSAVQVTLHWLIQQSHVSAIPRAATGQHRKQNFDIFDFELSAEDVERINALEHNGRVVNPSFAPWRQG